MSSEINDLNKLKTWDLVELPKGRTAVKGRWVYKTKRDPYGKLIKFKSRWVAKGFKQRALFYLAAYNDWEIEQIDVKLAFPNSPIDKELYIEQPTGFIVKGQEHKVCRLNSALYSLKQATKYSFYPLLKDSAAFLNKETGVYITCHVDDMLIFSSTISLAKEFKTNISKYLEISDLGPIKHYLGIEVSRDRPNKVITLS
ncbi:unnamed protein product [Cercospora beticola]|nr:unnamed protein product [Cercospora beticola]